MGAHDGHRKRLKARFRTLGDDALRDHEILELLLFYAIPRADTNATAHALIDRFGSLGGVFQAPAEALSTVPGVGEHAATLLKAVFSISSRIQIRESECDRVVDGSAAAAAFLAPRYHGLDCECVYLLCLDGRKRVTCCVEIARGATTQVEISVRKVVEVALHNGARGVILAHNHPDAAPIPSREDEIVTLQVSQALATIGITLVDHIILSDTEFISMADRGILSHTRKSYQPHIL